MRDRHVPAGVEVAQERHARGVVNGHGHDVGVGQLDCRARRNGQVVPGEVAEVNRSAGGGVDVDRRRGVHEIDDVGGGHVDIARRDDIAPQRGAVTDDREVAHRPAGPNAQQRDVASAGVQQQMLGCPDVARHTDVPVVRGDLDSVVGQRHGVGGHHDVPGRRDLVDPNRGDTAVDGDAAIGRRRGEGDAACRRIESAAHVNGVSRRRLGNGDVDRPGHAHRVREVHRVGHHGQSREIIDHVEGHVTRRLDAEVVGAAQSRGRADVDVLLVDRGRDGHVGPEGHGRGGSEVDCVVGLDIAVQRDRVGPGLECERVDVDLTEHDVPVPAGAAGVERQREIPDREGVLAEGDIPCSLASRLGVERDGGRQRDLVRATEVNVARRSRPSVVRVDLAVEDQVLGRYRELVGARAGTDRRQRDGALRGGELQVVRSRTGREVAAEGDVAVRGGHGPRGRGRDAGRQGVQIEGSGDVHVGSESDGPGRGIDVEQTVNAGQRIERDAVFLEDVRLSGHVTGVQGCDAGVQRHG